MTQFFDWRDYANDIYMPPRTDDGKIRESEADQRKRHNAAFCAKQRAKRLGNDKKQEHEQL